MSFKFLDHGIRAAASQYDYRRHGYMAQTGQKYFYMSTLFCYKSKKSKVPLY